MGCIQLNPEKVKAVLDLNRTTKFEDLRSVLGMFQYLGGFTHNLSFSHDRSLEVRGSLAMGAKSKNSHTTKPREYCAHHQHWHIMTPKITMTVNADVSSYGLVGVVLQLHQEGLKPVAAMVW